MLGRHSTERFATIFCLLLVVGFVLLQVFNLVNTFSLILLPVIDAVVSFSINTLINKKCKSKDKNQKELNESWVLFITST